jgi:hypothetical protein
LGVLSNKKHEIFCQLKADGKTNREAYIGAGYEDPRPAAQERFANKIMSRPHIRPRIDEIRLKNADIPSLAEEAAKDLVTRRGEMLWARFTQAVPVLNRSGEPIGEWKFDGNNAVKVWIQQGIEAGMFVHKAELRTGKLEVMPGNRKELVAQVVELIHRGGIAQDILRELTIRVNGDSGDTGQPEDVPVEAIPETASVS